MDLSLLNSMSALLIMVHRVMVVVRGPLSVVPMYAILPGSTSHPIDPIPHLPSLPRGCEFCKYTITAGGLVLAAMAIRSTTMGC